MSHRSSQNVLLRGVKRTAVLAAIEERLAEEGFVRVKGATNGVRITIRSTKDTVLVALDPKVRMSESASAWFDAEWATYLAQILDTEPLAIRVIEDGDGSSVTRFQPSGSEAHRFALTEQDLGEQIEIPAAVLGRRKGIVLKEASGEELGEALTKAFKLPPRWLHLWDSDLEEGDEAIVFRRRVELPELPRKAKATGFEPAAASYRGREYAVGSVSFGAEADLDSVASIMTELVRAFAPADGLRIRVTRGTKSEVLPIRFTRTARIKPETLSRGGSVELTAGPLFEKPMGSPIFWIANDPAVGGEEERAVPLHFGFALLRPGSARPELALAEAMSTVTEVAAAIPGCLAAVVTAQGAPLCLADTTLPYELLAGSAAKSKDGTWLRAHARAPGWRVLVPRARMKDLSRPPPADVTLERCPNGVLVRHDAKTPFLVGETTEIERWLLPALA